ncbi:hypothetical protein C1645_787758 [Glomus cerebriforme]|uniref:Uncharacterized protein n=1 Tax=Glomus cerebriforme TaxID=658196 RepID=A0A397SIS9_9GLOM|nr:hypothetical protein C1645_787758 [Glomus cerebriforme]
MTEKSLNLILSKIIFYIIHSITFKYGVRCWCIIKKLSCKYYRKLCTNFFIYLKHLLN